MKQTREKRTAHVVSMMRLSSPLLLSLSLSLSPSLCLDLLLLTFILALASLLLHACVQSRHGKHPGTPDSRNLCSVISMVYDVSAAASSAVRS